MVLRNKPRIVEGLAEKEESGRTVAPALLGLEAYCAGSPIDFDQSGSAVLSKRSLRPMQYQEVKSSLRRTLLTFFS